MQHAVIHARDVTTDLERTVTMRSDDLQVIVSDIVAHQNVGIIGPDNTRVTIDDLTQSMRVITTEHYEIHEGESFFVSYKSPDGADIADNGTIIMALTTTTHTCHTIWQVNSGGDAETELLEGSTITNGTATTAYNRNRTSANTSATTVVRDPTVNVDGTRLDHRLIPGGTGGNAGGGEGGARYEWILAPSTIYVFRITNRAGNAQPMSILVDWYEEE